MGRGPCRPGHVVLHRAVSLLRWDLDQALASLRVGQLCVLCTRLRHIGADLQHIVITSWHLLLVPFHHALPLSPFLQSICCQYFSLCSCIVSSLMAVDPSLWFSTVPGSQKLLSKHLPYELYSG